jgi:two-component system sensor histidine kinase HydH
VEQSSDPILSSAAAGDLPRPARAASVLALGYALVAIAYVMTSSWFAARSAASVEELGRIELVKGVGFVLVSSLALFFLARFLLRDAARKGLAVTERNVALQRSERAATAGLLAASLAHDINNVLTSVRMSLSFLERGQDDGGLDEMEAALGRVSLLSRRLLSVAGAEREEVRRYDLVGAIREGLSLARIHVDVKRCTVETAFDAGELPVRGPPRLLGRAVLNLVVNAAEAAGSGGRIRLEVRRDGEHALLEVHDDGPGIPAEVVERVFTPFFTTKELGTGLGLMSVRVCAEEHGGSAEVVESALGGAAFRLRLPLVGASEDGQSSSQA